jgi:hypothetical protein
MHPQQGTGDKEPGGDDQEKGVDGAKGHDHGGEEEAKYGEDEEFGLGGQQSLDLHFHLNVSPSFNKDG